MSSKVNPLQDLSHKIYFNDPAQNHHLHRGTNKIRTSKYTLLSFLPKSLYIQFLRLANIYFLVITVLTAFPDISPYDPIVSVVPLIFVLATSLIREGAEDWFRYKNDKMTNSQPTSTFSPRIVDKEEKSRFQPAEWKDLVVGDMVKVENDQQIPADILLLETSDENGAAYVETANLDGEKNLKLKQVRPETKQIIQSLGLEGLKGEMLVDAPNAKIHQFRGVMEIEGAPTIYLNYNNLVLRGTHLKNTDYIIGIVVYAGHETKLMKSQGKPKNKKSHMEAKLNQYIMWIFAIQCILCIILTILSSAFTDKYEQTQEGGQALRLIYLYADDEVSSSASQSKFLQIIISFGSSMLLLNTLIPISLMVSLELTKFFQARFMEFDDLIKQDNQRMKVLNMLVHEDLAKIDYIFADKTGTLTTNEMKFTYCSINGKTYTTEEIQTLDKVRSTLHSHRDQTPQEQQDQPKNESPSQQSDPKFDLFWLSLSLCHDVVIDKKKLNTKDLRSKYQGSSPDEVELVSMAAEAGFIFSEKKADVYSLVVQGKPREFLLMGKIDFSSDRKRMSVMMKDLESDKVYLFCKGADSMILKRLSGDTQFEILEKTEEDLGMFARAGLRTLAVGYRELEEKEFTDWLERYSKAQQEEFNVKSEIDPQIKLRELEEEIEKELVLLGATALEDKLQDGVPETISDLHKAGIKIWMLTGDKLETAENIGYSTKLLAQDTRVFKVDTMDENSTFERYMKIQRKILAIKEGNTDAILTKENLEDGNLHAEPASPNSFALIIDGEAISYTFNNEKLKKVFIELIPEFRTVICCRSTPNQKANVVSFVKHNLKKMTLAIGDGGNDVNMIQQAHVGIGIFGKEGNQAAFASDYAISQFYFLWRLLLVHGRWSYLRTANFITFFMYKNLIFTLAQFWFSLTSAFSGQTFYEDMYLSFYNTIFTSVAPVYYAAQEQDINPRETETIRTAMPMVYAEFREKNLFSGTKFMFWAMTGTLHSLAIYYATQAACDGTADSDGRVLEFWRESMTVFSGVFYTVFVVIIIGTNLYHKVTFLCYVILTFAMYFPVGALIFDEISTSIYHIMGHLLSTPKVWLIVFLTVVFCAFTVYIPKTYVSHFQPSLVDLLQRDRTIQRKKLKQEEPKTSIDGTKSTKKGFDFNANIMMNGWYDSVKAENELNNYVEK